MRSSRRRGITGTWVVAPTTRLGCTMPDREPPRRRTKEPLPEPDFNNPVERWDGHPHDAHTAIVQALQRAVLEMQAWVTAAYVTGPTADGAAEVAVLLQDTGDKLFAYAAKLPP